MAANEQRDVVSRSSRDRILELLRLGPHTVDELARGIGLTANGVRAQLTALERDGLVRREEIRYREGAGKPPWVYALSESAEAAFSRAYLPTLTALAETLSSEMDRGDLRALFARTGERLAAAAPRQADGTGAEFAKRLLESLGASVTIGHDGARAVVEGAACPLAETVRRCPDACEVVRSLLSEAAHVPVETRCTHAGVPRCRFTIG